MNTNSLPFEVVEKEDRLSPLQELYPTQCPHDRAYQTDAKPASGTHWVCADCGHCSTFVRDFK